MPSKLITRSPGNLVQDPFELGAAGMPYTTQADYLPIPAEAMGHSSIQEDGRSLLVLWAP